jgi:hypothetical protein
MQKRDKIIFGIIIGIFALFIFISVMVRFFSGPEDTWICSSQGWIKHGNPSSVMPTEGCNGALIGGQRDEHGCLGPAGYSWNVSEGECVREWISKAVGVDADGVSRYQVTDFQSCIDAGYPVMESSPRKCSTSGGRSFVEGD